MVDRPQHFRERFYQGLRKELHQKMTPFYKNDNIPYMQLLRMAREFEDELWTAKEIQPKGANATDPQAKEVLAVETDEESKKYTAFTLGPLGFYECNRMPFRATNAPATFQRLMESCFGDLNLNWCIIYLEDVEVYAPTVKEHLKRMEGVFQKLKDAGLKLKPNRCQLFKKSISYLGHVVSEEGVHTDPNKI